MQQNRFNTWGQFNTPSNHYQSNFKDNAVPFNQESVPDKKMIITTEQEQTSKCSCVVVDSRNRNTSKYPNINNWSFHFNPSDTFQGAALFEPYNNIASIRLVECLVPDFTGDHPYLILEIPELDETLSGTNDTLSKAFTILLPDRTFNGVIHCRTDGMPYCKKTWNPPKGSFSKWTLTFKTPNGDLYSFGAGNTMLVFEIESTIIDKNSVIKPLIY